MRSDGVHSRCREWNACACLLAWLLQVNEAKRSIDEKKRVQAKRAAVVHSALGAAGQPPSKRPAAVYADVSVWGAGGGGRGAGGCSAMGP